MTVEPGETVEPAELETLANLEDFERAARGRLSGTVFDFYQGGAGDEWTLGANRGAFARWALRPRVLVDVSSVDASTTVLGHPVSFPVLLAPVAFQRMAHPDGEVAAARAAARAGTAIVVSTSATASIEEVAGAGGTRWFQLYAQRDRGETAALIDRASASGYRALVLTVDAPLLGRRERDERNGFSLPPGLGLANFGGQALPGRTGSGLAAYSAARMDPGLTWTDVEWVRDHCDLPLLLKGILRADDALRAVESGVAGVIVSNHGGRQLDGAIPGLLALPEIVEAVGGRAEVLVDGGVRRGVDVLRALALGARAVLVGRPYVWGLAVGGEAGALRVLEMLRDELTMAMALSGTPTVEDVDRSLVVEVGGATV